MATLKNVGAWERGNVGTWERGNVGTWERGNVGTWERKIINYSILYNKHSILNIGREYARTGSDVLTCVCFHVLTKGLKFTQNFKTL